ncbi:MAG: FkbM family methyltransferase [Acidobacteriaceae bacterium]|nr:FkbM family methyltransferase [Acidobacteriaceae bacterium]
MHQIGNYVFVDSPTLDYHPSTFRWWQNEIDRCNLRAKENWFYVYNPRSGDLIVDIGAGKGEDTIAFSSAVGPAGRVISMEAYPLTFHCLRLFCEINALDNVTPVHYAVMDKSGPVTMKTSEGWQGNSIEMSNKPGLATISGITLDDFIAQENIHHIDFLKVNIEGAEGIAIGRMQETLRITRTLCISCHDFLANEGAGEHFRTKALVQDAVKRAGFTLVSRDMDPRPYIADQVNAFRE